MAYIVLNVGPMFAGKSMAGIVESRRELAIGRRSLMIVHAADSARYGDEIASVRTHAGDDERGSHVVRADRLLPLIGDERFVSADLVCVDEVQFFPDLFDFVRAIERLSKTFVFSGLDGDAERRPFGQTLDIVPLCDEVHKLSAYCMRCRDRTPAAFTLRTVAGTGEQVQVGGADKYVAVCRRHYLSSSDV